MKKVLSLVFILLFFTSKAQERVYFPFFELINVDEGYQYSTSKLFKTYMDQDGRYQMTLPPRPEGLAGAQTFPETQRIARELGTPLFITGELNALEDVMIISVSLYQTSDGKLIWSDVVKAVTVDDLDPTLQLLAKAVGTKTKASQMEDIYSVSKYENKELTKKDASSTFGLLVGGYQTFFTNTKETFSSGFGAKISYDLRDLILDINGEFYFGNVDIVSLNLNGLYPFDMGRKAPFIGGGLGYGQHRIKLEQSPTPDPTGIKN